MTEPTPPADDFFPPRPSRRRWPWIVAAAVVLAAVAAAGIVFFTRDTDPYADLKPLAKRDPGGAEACLLLRTWLTGGLVDEKTGKPDNVVLVSGALSEYAAKSTTPAILAAVGSPVLGADQDPLGLTDDLVFTNLRKLHAACKAEGVKLPPYTDAP